MEVCSPICIHFWVVISKLITPAALLKFPVTLSLFWNLMNKYLIQALRENWVLWLLLCHMTGLCVGHSCDVLPRTKESKQVPCTSGLCLSLWWKIPEQQLENGLMTVLCWWSICGAQVLCHSPAQQWRLAACLLWVVTPSVDKLVCLTQLHIYSGSTLCCR